jgi:predicted nucleic acid-binding protein
VRVLSFGPREALIAADLFLHLETAGQLIGLEDVLIGATALANEAAVVTRNARHLSRIPGLDVIDWWV